MSPDETQPVVVHAGPGRKRLSGRTVMTIIFALIVLIILGVLLSNRQATKPKVVTAVTPRIVTVQLTRTGFVPATVTVPKGSVVEWRSVDETTTHIIEANPYPTGKDVPGLKSPQLGKGATYRFKFVTGGTYGYHDRLQPTLSGTVVVK